MNLKRFLSFMKFTLLTAVLVTTIGLTGCDNGEEEPAPTKNIWELVEEDSNLSMLEAQLSAAGLDAQLSGTNSFTLFAPSDQAMNTLLATLGLDDFSTISEDVIQAVLKYHIVESQKLYDELSGNLTTVQGENISVVTSTTGDKLLDTGATDDAGITTKDVKATNGVIHIINTVMVPPTIGDLIVKTLGTVAQPLLLAEDFSTLSAGIQMAEAFAVQNSQPTLLGTLEAKGVLIQNANIITVFAPPNAVFEEAGIEATDFTGQQWYGIIMNHIVVGDLYQTADFGLGVSFDTMLGQSVTVVATDAPTDPANGITTGIVLDSEGAPTPNAQIAVLDLLTATGATPANNGYINAIAGILTPGN